MNNLSIKKIGNQSQVSMKANSRRVKKSCTIKQPCCAHQPRLTAVANAVVACFRKQANHNHPSWVCGLSLAVALSLANPVPAATFSVTNTNDSGAGSLRQAVIDANANPGLDDIAFSSVSGDITLTSGQIEITDSINISGPGAQVLTVDGNNVSRIFSIYDSGSYYSEPVDLMISGLTLTNAANGSAVDVNVGRKTVNLAIQDSVISGNGESAIHLSSYNKGDLTIQDSVISGNSGTAMDHFDYYGAGKVIVRDSAISNNQGDGLRMYHGTLMVQNTIVSGNTQTGISAGRFRGGVTTSIENSTISGNGAGGVYVYFDNLTIDSSTISGNGYGISQSLFPDEDTETIISNTTISGNKGLGIVGFYGGVIQHSTITGNDGGIGHLGSYFYGIYNAVIQNSIVAGNTAATGKPDLGKGVIDIEWSLIQDPGSTVINNTVPGSNLIGQDPVLGALEDNSGLTKTHALLSGSPAINSGDPNFTPPPDFDQRGPGFPRVVGGRVDIGAFESGSKSSAAAMLAALGDINGDGSEDIAVLIHDAMANTVTATIKDAEDGSFIQQVNFNGNRVPVALKVMADIDNNGAPELVVLGQGQGTVKAQVRDSLSGAFQNTVAFRS